MKTADPNAGREHGPLHRLSAGQGPLLILAAAALLVLGALEATRSLPADPLYPTKLAAAQRMQLATRALREERLVRGIPIEPEIDPNATGLIGPEYTAITTTLGYLPAKRTSTNPNMAGVLVAMLDRAGAKPGDCAAVGFSGSFPALNIAVLCALQAMELRPAMVSSVGASSYGANDPRFTWLDMEQILNERGLSPWRSDAVSPGGVASIPTFFGDEGIREMQAAIARSGLPALDEQGDETLQTDVARRMALYETVCGGRPAVFINVGGSLPALGNCPQAHALPTGLLPPDIRSAAPGCGVIFRMAAAGVPVIHLLNIRKIARDYGLPVDPAHLPAVPDGRVMSQGGYSRTAALIGLAVLGMLGSLVKSRNK
ncbi:MAG: poly-gamma-glutamate system protein [Deltaproteobacteria bacterium]|nr:poly-gamma-glutamate system protein [Deltaproteobacteria bacterium]